MQNNSTCAICGKSYEVCLSCQSKMKLYHYKRYTDTSEHFKVYEILKGHSNEVYDDTEARDMLGRVDLTDLKEFRPHIKEAIKQIMGASTVDGMEESDVYEDSNAQVDSVDKEKKSIMGFVKGLGRK